jgi:hypothetical protein
MNKSIRTAFAALTLVAAAGLAACASDGGSTTTETTAVAEAKASNTKCPFTGGKVNPAVTSTHDGHTIGFCCAGCKGKFDKMDDAHQHAMMEKAK